MELNELKQTWQQYDSRLEQTRDLNMRIMREMKLDKTRSFLNRHIVARLVEAAFGLLMVIVLLSFASLHLERTHYVVAAAIPALFMLVGIGAALRDIAMIRKMDFAEPVAALQKQILRIRMRMLQNLRLTLLSLPFYPAYIILFFGFAGIDIYAIGNPGWWYTQIVLAVLLVPFVIWLQGRLKPESLHHRWVKFMLDGVGLKRLSEAGEQLNELVKFETEMGDPS